MLRESLRDAGEIIENILNQPLAVEGSTEDVSLLTASQQFVSTHGQSEQLARILQTFSQYPEATRMLLGELELISNELKHAAR